MNDLLGGRYRLGEALGRGGMGTVYEAVQENLGRHVAVKLLDERLSFDREQLERFRREAEIVASLGHPNIVQVTDFQYPEELGKQPFLVMELLRGESLGSLLARDGIISAERIAFVVSQVLSALAAAHRAGVVHRDIKPDNIFLLADAAVPDTVKVLDFGIAKLSVEGQQKLTGTGAMLGTPAFMAPEQARGEVDVDARADLYAVGATMYQALAGKLPYDAPSIPALLFAIVEETPTPLAELRPDLPRDMVALVERAMAKKREDRFPDADAMRRALSPWSGLAASLPPSAVRAVTISATAATIASTPPPANANPTPVVMHRTPPPTPVVPYAPYAPPPAPPPPVVDAAASKNRNRLVIILAVLAVIFGVKVLDYLRDTRGRARRDTSQEADPIARQATSIGLGFAAQALATSVPTAPTAPIIASASATATTSIATPLTASAKPPKRKRYGGKDGWKAGGNFSECKKCNMDAFNNDMGLRANDISACFAASEYEPPLHENPYFTVTVEESGHLSLVRVAGGAPNLDQCLFKVVQSVGIKGTGVAQFGFQGECTKGCFACCD